MEHRRLLALTALVLFVLGVAGAVAITISAFPRGLFVLAFVAIASPVREGARRRLIVAGGLPVAALVMIIVEGPVLVELGVVLALSPALAATRVAFTAAEHGLPYPCIPAGTRNHFALDLGLTERTPA
jgi:hypothetical protein